jgi:hypothetical protein
MPNLEFQNSDEPLDSWEFTHFLYLFRAAYVHALTISPEPAEAILQSTDRLVERFKLEFNGNGDETVADLFSTELGNEDLRFVRLDKSSPLQMGCSCVVSALTLAVIISGGKVDLMGLKFTLPPLGVGIKSLREAFRLPPVRRTRKK